MNVLGSLVSTVLDAVFPVPRSEAEVLSLTPRQAWLVLPRAKEFPLLEACSVFAYRDEHVWRLIWSIKYKKSRAAASIAAFALYEFFRVYARFCTPIVVVPMPITSQRRRERGYNQCELLAEELEKIDGTCLNIANLLVRTKHKSRQTLKDRSERLKSADHIFAVDKTLAAAVSLDAFVIVIDDVVTTGSTMKEAISTLRSAGYAHTFGLSVAH